MTAWDYVKKMSLFFYVCVCVSLSMESLNFYSAVNWNYFFHSMTQTVALFNKSKTPTMRQAKLVCLQV